MNQFFLCFDGVLELFDGVLILFESAFLPVINQELLLNLFLNEVFVGQGNPFELHRDVDEWLPSDNREDYFGGRKHQT